MFANSTPFHRSIIQRIQTKTIVRFGANAASTNGHVVLDEDKTWPPLNRRVQIQGSLGPPPKCERRRQSSQRAKRGRIRGTSREDSEEIRVHDEDKKRTRNTKNKELGVPALGCDPT
mmetsp:Transcript_8494/g.16017  ORF Transcript_8494/g.16017 Transcript_8494/m.16017 type:complete len:117 (-) Transcript_8494:70-420(-)